MALVVAGVIMPATSATAAPKNTVLTQRLVVGWQGKNTSGSKATFVIPGIGTGEVVCRANATYIRITATNRNAETQMWSTKFEQKKGKQSSAVKNARIYRYANFDDTGKGGTGKSAREGFNQLSKIENSSSGHMYGVISQRPGRNTAAAKMKKPATTSFTLSWNWNGFRKAQSKRSCVVSAVFTTKVATKSKVASRAVNTTKTVRKVLGGKAYRVGTRATMSSKGTSLATTGGVNWHGEADAAAVASQTFQLPGIGRMQLVCSPATDESSLRFMPSSDNVSVWVEASEGEGFENIDYGSYYGQASDFPEIELPRNGMIRAFISKGNSRKAEIILSSYRKTNGKTPQSNLCETAFNIVPR